MIEAPTPTAPAQVEAPTPTAPAPRPAASAQPAWDEGDWLPEGGAPTPL